MYNSTTEFRYIIWVVQYRNIQGGWINYYCLAKNKSTVLHNYWDNIFRLWDNVDHVIVTGDFNLGFFEKEKWISKVTVFSMFTSRNLIYWTNGIDLGSTIFLFPQGVYIQDRIVFSILHSVVNLMDKCKVGSSLISIMYS